MRLTSYTDYALRTLMYLATHRDQLVTIQNLAELHGIAKNHLTKVVHQLGQLGFVDTARGRNGGLRLGREPAKINIGDVVRQTEPDFYMAECFDRNNTGCAFLPSCTLKGVLGAATLAYLQVLDGVTLEDLIHNTKNGHGSGADSVKRIRVYTKTKL
jgi:Rrf2 family transcriptional regulator, nitric oxide-sensitive transcriptional repressor